MSSETFTVNGMEFQRIYPSSYSPLPFVYHDGGRAEAGFKGQTGDCSCRAISIATGLSYLEVYQALNSAAQSTRISKRKPKRGCARTGVYRPTLRQYLSSLGWTWKPTMFIGQGCKVHLRQGELPNPARLIVSVSKHLCAVIDGVVYDTHNPCRDGERCVYGYWQKV